jgi:hypothetical protein
MSLDTRLAVLAEVAGVDIAELVVDHVNDNSPSLEWSRERAA